MFYDAKRNFGVGICYSVISLVEGGLMELEMAGLVARLKFN